MKKLFSLSFALLAFGFQVSANATQDSPDELVDSFCTEVQDVGTTDKDEMAELLRSYMTDLDNPTMEQILALSQVAVKIQTGQSINSVCN